MVLRTHVCTTDNSCRWLDRPGKHPAASRGRADKRTTQSRGGSRCVDSCSCSALPCSPRRSWRSLPPRRGPGRPAARCCSRSRSIRPIHTRRASIEGSISEAIPGRRFSRPPAVWSRLRERFPGNGKSLTILTSDGWSVTLTQLGSIAVAKGASVAEGDAVATIGPSGDAEVAGPYMQLGIRHADQDQGYVDPQTLLPPRSQAPSGPTTTGGTVQPPSAVSVPTSTTPVDGPSVTTDPAAVGTAAACGSATAGGQRGGSGRCPARRVGWQQRRPRRPSTDRGSERRTERDRRPRCARRRAGRSHAARRRWPHRLRSLLAPSCRSPSTAPISTLRRGRRLRRADRRSLRRRTRLSKWRCRRTSVVAHPRVATAETAVRALRPPAVSRPLVAVDGALAAISALPLGAARPPLASVHQRHMRSRPRAPVGTPASRPRTGVTGLRRSFAGLPLWCPRSRSRGCSRCAADG